MDDMGKNEKRHRPASPTPRSQNRSRVIRKRAEHTGLYWKGLGYTADIRTESMTALLGTSGGLGRNWA